MLRLLQSRMIAMMMGGFSFLFTVYILVEKPLIESQKRPPETEEVPTPAGFWQQYNPEVDQMAAELRKQKEALDKREAELRKLAAQLQAEREAINQVTQRVAQLQAEFDANVVRVKEEELPQLKKLTKMYGSMSPEGQMAIFNELDDTVVVKLMSMMKEEQSALLLDMMAKEGETQAKRAAALSESLRRTLGEKRKT